MRDIKKDNLKSALCYVPIIAIIMHFLEEKKSERLKKHIRYGIILFVSFVLINIILNNIYLGFFTIFTTLGYLGISIFLGFKVYNGENIDVEILDNIDKKVQEKIGNNKQSEKKDEEIEDILKNSNF